MPPQGATEILSSTLSLSEVPDHRALLSITTENCCVSLIGLYKDIFI